MSFEYYVWGELAFPTREAVASWLRARARASAYADWGDRWQGSPSDAEATVSDVVRQDPNTGHFLDVDESDNIVSVLGLVHRDDFSRQLLAAFRGAAAFGAEGRILIEQSLDGEDGYILRFGGGASSFEASASAMVPEDAKQAILDEHHRGG